MNNAKINDLGLKEMFEAIMEIQNVEECEAFFDDLCTILELKAMAQRFQVAKMLIEHKVYSDIVKGTGASTATISRVNRSLNYGSDGYNIILERLNKKAK